MRRFLSLYGCDSETIFRYCAIGDLGLTGLNDLSRNRTLGMLIGKGFDYSTGNTATLVEGHRTIRLFGETTRERGIADQFPIVQALYRLMYEGSSLNDYIMSVVS